MTRIYLSTRFTFIHKFVLPVVFVLGAIWFAVEFFEGWLYLPGDVPGGFMLIVWGMVAVNLLWIGWIAIRSYKVTADAENFYVSNYRKEIVIPRAELYEATEMRWVQPYWITLHLRGPSEFGEKIVFIPPWRFAAFWTANPLVDELNAGRARC